MMLTPLAVAGIALLAGAGAEGLRILLAWALERRQEQEVWAADDDVPTASV